MKEVIKLGGEGPFEPVWKGVTRCCGPGLFAVDTFVGEIGVVVRRMDVNLSLSLSMTILSLLLSLTHKQTNKHTQLHN